MKKDTTEFRIELQELDSDEAIHFAYKLIEEAKNVKLIIKCTHLLKDNAMTEIVNMYQNKLIKMYKKQKRGIEKLYFFRRKSTDFQKYEQSDKGV
jgi:hypothetical protein